MTPTVTPGLSLEDADLLLTLAEKRVECAATIGQAVEEVRGIRRALAEACVTIEAEAILAAAAVEDPDAPR